MEELKIPYFDLSADIIEQFTYKRGNVQEQADAIGITHFKLGNAKAKLEATKGVMLPLEVLLAQPE